VAVVAVVPAAVPRMIACRGAVIRMAAAGVGGIHVLGMARVAGLPRVTQVRGVAGGVSVFRVLIVTGVLVGARPLGRAAMIGPARMLRLATVLHVAGVPGVVGTANMLGMTAVVHAADMLRLATVL
jgi:hypothetical protein